MSQSDERSERKRRGRRRGRSQPPEPQPTIQEPEELEEPDEDSAASEDVASDPEPRRFRVPSFLSRRKQPPQDQKEGSGRPSQKPASPVDFWRRGRARPYRPAADTERSMGMWQRITGLYFPPWVPVVAIIIAVFGILGLLFFARSATGAPRIGDHWHATYEVIVCGQKQPDIPNFEAAAGSPGTHADGIMHLHPFAPRGEGSGSNLRNFFLEAGGKLDSDELRMSRGRETYKNGDECPDGTIGVLQVFLNGGRLDGFQRYIAKDGDQIVLVFGPPDEVVQLDDRTVIADEQATREITLEVSGNESATQFTPDSVELSAGEAVRFRVRNTAAVSHSFRASGADGEYGTGDDFVVTPEGQDPEASSGVLLPGEEGSVVVRLDSPGSVEFRDETARSATGEIVVIEDVLDSDEDGDADSPEEVDVTVEVVLGDNSFTPSTIEVGAGEQFRIELVNEGQFIHNLRIAGPDGEYRTDDDIVSDIDPLTGERAEVIGVLTEPGEYAFRCDFHPAEQVGVIIVK